jgi:small subunit ribosomal protein S16
MPVKIRLARHGRKGIAYYHIVVADSRTPRDGKFIERIGLYNPNTNPATIKLDFDKALSWLQKGAVPSDTCRAILSYEGILYKSHLLKGVKKGAFDEATANSRFESWKAEKLGKIQSKSERVVKEKETDIKKRITAESKVKDARAEAVAKKLSNKAEAAKKAAEEAAAEETAEAPAEGPADVIKPEESTQAEA